MQKLSSADRLPTPITADVEAAVLALNNAPAVELSWLEGGRLGALLGQSFYARRLGHLAAFLIAFDERADYDSPNYLWFRQRYSRFVYVDRIVVDRAARQQGLARLLYQDLFRQAVAAGHQIVGCEVNSDPPNPASDAFHAGFGFVEVGRASIHGGVKSVRYLAYRLEHEGSLR
ncbi:MAG: GNAT family N-acetyltransferase [Rhodospirillales bacterium]|nr:GNAT family N-acetyltransferase [Rhodospirillales bacterium]